VYPPPPKVSRALPLALFFASLFTTTVAGAMWNTGSFGLFAPLAIMLNPRIFLSGLPFSIAIVTILLSHELGHYLTCRRYGIYATLPHFIPIPWPLSPFGTFGALIKIKSMFGSARQLFDVGIAGPLAGFVFIIPALIVGLAKAEPFHPSADSSFVFYFGEPLLFKLAKPLFFPGGSGEIVLHPIGMAAWFGMLATSLNLLPVGQLDGGHIVYALFGPRGHRIISIVTLAALAFLGIEFWTGYLVFGALAFLIGFRHPPTLSDQTPLGARRIVLAVVALIVLVLTFMPIPVEFFEDLSGL
jgi:membrane-associated protease RseP (regulator of RpoE activity)